MREHVRVVVVGAGIAGAAAFERLAAAGHEVILVEREVIGSGATGATGGVVRCFHLDPVLCARAIHGWRRYRELARSGLPDVTFVECGLLYIPASGRAALARAAVRRLEVEIPVEWMGADQITRRFGHLLRVPPQGAVWEPQAGYMHGSDTARVLIRLGRRAGGRVKERTSVHGLHIEGGAVTGVQTSSGTIAADAVVIAAGAGTPALLDAMSIGHRLATRPVGAELRIPCSAEAGDHPAYVDDELHLYGRGDPGSGGIVVGLAGAGSCDEAVPAPGLGARPARLEEIAARRFPWIADSARRGAARAVECFGPDHRWVHALGPRGAVLAAGFNGGGFKMAPWVGDEVERLIARSTRTIERDLQGAVG